MFKSKNTFMTLVESVYDREMNNGFLIGDYVRINKNALRTKVAKKWLEGMSEDYRKCFDNMIDTEFNIRIAQINSPCPPSFAGLITAQEAIGAPRFCTIYVEWTAGRWGDIMVVPACILKLDRPVGNNWAPGVPRYNDNKEVFKPVEVKDGDDNHKNPKKNTSIPSVEAKDGRNQAKKPIRQ